MAFQFGAPQPFNFNTGQDPAIGHIIYNSPGNFAVGWQQIMDQLGLSGQPSSNYNKWFQGWAANAKGNYANAVAQSGNKLSFEDWANQYVPGLGNLYGMQSAQDRGENPRFVGHPRFLG